MFGNGLTAFQSVYADEGESIEVLGQRMPDWI